MMAVVWMTVPWHHAVIPAHSFDGNGDDNGNGNGDGDCNGVGDGDSDGNGDGDGDGDGDGNGNGNGKRDVPMNLPATDERRQLTTGG
jgi:hypothetical protein